MSDSSARKLPVSNTTLNPPGWPQPRGYANGVKARGEMVFVGGMIGWDTNGVLPKGFVAQTKQLLENIVAVLKEGGAGPEHVVRMTCYVIDRHEYVNSRDEIGAAWKEIMGPNYPAMALIEVKGLVETAAKVEIETTAVVED